MANGKGAGRPVRQFKVDICALTVSANGALSGDESDGEGKGASGKSGKPNTEIK